MKEEQFPAGSDAKTGYLTELRRLLTALPEEEREAALTYYGEYFDDAGPEASNRVLNELGPAEQLAEQILSGYSRDYLDATPHSSSAQVPARPEDAAESRRREEEASAEKARRAAATQKTQTTPPPPPRRSGAATVLIILLVILALPLLIPLAVTIFAVTFAIIAAVLSVALAVGISVLAVLALGIVLIVAGFGLMIPHTLSALIACGAGVTLLGLGILLMMLCVFLFGKLAPAVFRLMVRLLRWPFERRVARA